MVKKKYWVYCDSLKTIIGLYITLFCVVFLFSLGFSFLAHSSAINTGVQDSIKAAVLNGLKWYGIIMPITTLFFIIWFIFKSDRVELTDTSIKYYRFISSKTSKEIKYNIITEGVLSCNLWNDKRERTTRRRMILFNKKDIIMEFDVSSTLALALVLHLGEEKFKIVSDRGNLKTMSKYFNVNFMNLNYEEQIKLLSYHCKWNCSKYKTGEEILNKKRK